MKKIIYFLLIFLPITVFAETIQNPTLDEQIGQMIMVGFRGTEVNKNSAIVQDIQKYNLGGVILYDKDGATKKNIRNVTDPKQLKTLTRTLQRYSKSLLLIALDQEGGNVDRLKPERGFGSTMTMERLGKLDDVKKTAQNANFIASKLAAMGINTDLAPVVDLNINPKNPIIGSKKRSFSADPAIVIKHAKVFIDAFHQKNIVCALKHFPGHGSSLKDSHKSWVDVTHTWSEKELIPFETLIEEDPCEMVMVAHVYNANLDETYPASLSQKTITNLLRDKLQFQGVVISDDLGMKAISDNYKRRDAILLAINAGNDILIFSNNEKNYEPHIGKEIFLTIKELINEGKIDPKRITESYIRIQALKHQLVERNRNKKG